MPALAPTTTPAGQWLRAIRQDRDWTQHELADALGVTQATVSKAESGKRDITPELAYRLIVRIGVDAEEVARYVPIPGLLGLLSYPQPSPLAA